MINSAEAGVENVIIQFGSFQARDRWVEVLKSCVKRVYQREPWVAATIDADTRASLSRDSGVKIVQDSQLSPMNGR
ncbi:MAG: hypothetical protein DWQ37_04160 [Planctomycetota bacterium]|nr:MAG: hypothetical protein DWQ37_04160 [Planctomycetota bacterium]